MRGGATEVNENQKWATSKKRLRTTVLDNRLPDSSEVVSPTRRPPFTPQEDSWYSFLLRGPYTINHVAQHCVLCNWLTVYGAD
jgi:hypothetical protein